MKRTRLERRTPLARGTSRGRTKKQRSAEEFRRVYGSKERVQFVASLPCVVLGCPRQPCDNCHSETGGTGRKANAETIYPSCRVHHQECHAIGVRSFERLHGIDLAECAASTERQWHHHQAQPVKLSAIVPGVVRAIVEGGE